MAIYHLTVKVLSRSNGAKAVGSAAYRSGEKLKEGSAHETEKIVR